MGLCASASIFNLTAIYNETHNITNDGFNRFSAHFGAKLSEAICRLSVDIFRLLQFYDQTNRQLECPSDGSDYHRFDLAMQNANDILELTGSPHQNHVCSLCTTVEEYHDENGNLRAKGV